MSDHNQNLVPLAPNSVLFTDASGNLTTTGTVPASTLSQVLAAGNDAGAQDIDNLNELIDGSGMVVFSVPARFLFDQTSTLAIDFNGRLLYDASNQISINWLNRILEDVTGNTSLDWANRSMFDSGNLLSIDYENRQLHSTTQPMLEWGTNSVNYFTDLIGAPSTTRIILGTDASDPEVAAQYRIYVAQDGLVNGDTLRSALVQYNNTDASGPQFQFTRARGTKATPTKVLAGDSLGSIRFVGKKTSGYNTGVLLEAIADSDFTTTQATSLIISTSNVSRWKINGSGNLLATTDGAVTIGTGTGDGPTYAGANRPSAVYVRDSLVVGDSAININEDGWISSGNDTNSIAYLGSDGGVAQFGFQNTGSFPLTGFQNVGTPGELRIFSDNPTVSLLWDVDGSGDIGAAGDNRPASIFLTGDLVVGTAGSGLQIAEGSNAKMGTAILVGGVVVVSNTSVTANSRIFLTSQVDGGVPGFLRVSTRTAGTSFTIQSSSVLDTSTVAFLIVEPS